MKKILLIITGGFISLAFLSADVYIKEIEHTDAYTIGTVKTPASDIESELWIKDKKIVLNTGREKSYIFDLAKKTFVFINHKDKSYAEMAVPLDPAKIFTDQLAAKYDMYKETGTTAKTGKTMEILGKKCTGYEAKTWRDSAGIRFDERSFIVWTSTDVPFDLDIYHGMLRCIRVLYNRDEAFLKNFDEMRGLQLGVDSTIVKQGTEIKVTHRDVEMTEKHAPEDAFAIPKEYTKKEKLSFRDLWK